MVFMQIVSCCAHTLCLQRNSLGDGVYQAEAGQDNPTAGEPLVKLKNARGASHATCV